ncbi:MAG TPA: non-ribosomal peptide synthetase [Thermoanaerobaculia bacterium]|nr:non-ribosomal peptide synthetase [Thermoanaerobaculia bacterium]
MAIARAQDVKEDKDPKDTEAGGLAVAFSAVAVGQPDRPAVRGADGSATYGELDRLAAGVARRLIEVAAPSDRPVLLIAEPGLRLVAAMLGVWRAGRFFVALDPVAPAERNARIAADAEARVMIAEPGRAWGLAESAKPRTQLALDVAEWLEAAGDASERPVAVDRGTIAALTYTSGSTGRPKGVIQTHGAVLRNARLNRSSLEVEPTDRCTMLYPPSVNPALRDLATALLSGAELLPYLVTTEGIDTLGPWLEERKITIYSSGVTLFRQFASTLPAGATLGSVRRVRLGGEPVGRREIELFRRVFRPGARLFFGLGTTETGTVTTCFYGHDEPLPRAVPLGLPAEGIEIELLDAAGLPVSEGEAGEIAVCGDDLAGGYWRDPEVVDSLASSLLPDRGASPRALRYRTGDLARRAADGTLEYLGRAGARVKIRGLRIDLAEVERALAELPGVADAAVAVVPGRSAADGDDPELIACLVGSGDPPLVRAELRRALAERLPQAMVPARFRLVERLPMTANGKLDRRALAALAGRELPPERTLTYPRDPIETRLAALWCEVLGREWIGTDESFFDLGGDSRSAVTLFAAIERRFGTALPLALLFSAQTVRALAVHLREGVRRDALVPVLWFGREGDATKPALFCIPAVDGYAFVFRPLAAELADQVALAVLQFPGLDGKEAPMSSVEDLAEALIGRMRARQPAGPYFLLGHSYGGLVAYEMTRRLVARGERVSLLAMCDSHTPGAVPLFARLVRDGEQLALAARRIWQASGGRLPAAIRAVGHMAQRALRRRVGNTLVEHEIHEVRRISTAARKRYRFGAPADLPGTAVWLLRAAPGPGSAHLWCRWVAPDNGWERRLVGPLRIVDVPGDHIRMLNPPNVAVLAEVLQRALAVGTAAAPESAEGDARRP